MPAVFVHGVPETPAIWDAVRSKLARDDDIEVAGPVLTQSNRLDDDTLIEAARNKSQAHLMAISNRKSLSGAVTDVLVLRGNDEVVQNTVNNPGAEFTERQACAPDFPARFVTACRRATPLMRFLAGALGLAF